LSYQSARLATEASAFPWLRFRFDAAIESPLDFMRSRYRIASRCATARNKNSSFYFLPAQFAVRNSC
jgi:hypothetical protein